MVSAAPKCGDAVGSWQGTIACTRPIPAASSVTAVPVSTGELWGRSRLLQSGHQRSAHSQLSQTSDRRPSDGPQEAEYRESMTDTSTRPSERHCA